MDAIMENYDVSVLNHSIIDFEPEVIFNQVAEILNDPREYEKRIKYYNNSVRKKNSVFYENILNLAEAPN
jgi:hypothetical protein